MKSVCSILTAAHGRKRSEVEGTVFDLRQPKQLTEILNQHHSQLEIAGGLDHNYVLNGVGFRPDCQLG